MRALLRAPHPNYTGSLLNFARVLDYTQAGPRKVEAIFVCFLSLRVVHVSYPSYSGCAVKLLECGFRRKGKSAWAPSS